MTLLVLTLLALTSAWAASPTWADLPNRALDSWAEAAGAGWDARVAGAERAAAQVPVGPRSVRAEAQVGLPEQEQLLLAVDLPLTTGARQRRAWRARAELTEAEAAQARWQWVLEVHDAWEAWWVAATLAEDLDHYARDSAADLDALQGAVDQGTLAPMALDDLRAEWVQVSDEAAAMAIEADVARQVLEGLIGPVGPAPAAPPPGSTNPWSGLLGAVLPQVDAASARAAAADAEAAALSAARRPVVSAGPMAARGADGQMRPFGWVGVTVPLQAGVAPARRELLAEGDASRADVGWTRRRAEAELRGEAARWDGLRERLEVLDRQVIAPLEARRERLEAALDEALVTADRVVRARRDAHEAEHQRIRVLGAMLASEARAATLARTLDGGVE